MSFVFVTPDLLAISASDLAGIGSAIGAANAAMATPSTAVVAVAADDVSTAVASLFSGYAQSYQALGGQAGAFHDQFVRTLNAAAATPAAGQGLAPEPPAPEDSSATAATPAKALAASASTATPATRANSAKPARWAPTGSTAQPVKLPVGSSCVPAKRHWQIRPRMCKCAID
ncbi:PE family protein [Mycobacterium riyadhense]|uniref:PE family protein n=1 Tax=Mycobacterium riyadhense TaxID=486698 RepID=UPI00194F3DAD